MPVALNSDIRAPGSAPEALLIHPGRHQLTELLPLPVPYQSPELLLPTPGVYDPVDPLGSKALQFLSTQLVELLPVPSHHINRVSVLKVLKHHQVIAESSAEI